MFLEIVPIITVIQPQEATGERSVVTGVALTPSRQEGQFRSPKRQKKLHDFSNIQGWGRADSYLCL